MFLCPTKNEALKTCSKDCREGMGAQKRESSHPAPSCSREPNVRCCSILPTIGAREELGQGEWWQGAKEGGGRRGKTMATWDGKGGRGVRQGGDGTRRARDEGVVG